MIKMAAANELFSQFAPNYNALLGSIWLFVIIILIAVGLGGIIFGIWWKFQWKFKCYILEELTDGGTRLYVDKGRIQKRRDKTKAFRLKFFKMAILPIPPLSAFMIGKKGGKCVFLKKFGMNEFDFIPLGIYLKGLQTDIVPFPQERRNWTSVELKRSIQKYGGFWDKYGQLILHALTIVFVLIAIIFIVKMVGDFGADIVAASNKIAEAMTTFSSTCGGGGGSAAPPPNAPF